MASGICRLTSSRDFGSVLTNYFLIRAGLNWQDHIEVDKKYIRPTEVDALIGDPSKAERELGWRAKTHWKELAELMGSFLDSG